MHLDITTRDYKTLKYLLNAYLPGTTVWAFGSRAKFTSKPESDLDLVAFIQPGQESELAELKDAFAESDLPFKVDILDWDVIPDNFKQNIQKEYVQLQDTETQTAEIPPNWKFYKLGEFASINPRLLLKQEYEYSFVEMKDLAPSFKYVSPSAKRKFKGGSKFNNGDTLFARITPCLENGKISQVKNLENGIGFGSTEFIVFRGKENISDNDFVYYLTRSDDVRNRAIQAMTGTSGRQRVEKTALENIEIIAPDLQVQQSIANIISSLDDKIEINQQMNQTLEGIAQTIFKEWFVNFNFPGFDGEMVDGLPKGWKNGKLGRDFNLTMGQSPLGESLNKIGQGTVFYQGRTDFGFRFPENRVYTTEPNRMANKLDTLISVRAPVGDINMAIEQCCIGRGLSSVRHKSRAYSYTYYAMKNIDSIFKGFESEGTVFGSINKANFENIDIIIPKDKIIQKFEEIANSIDKKILNNSLEIISLTNIRDRLLPQLMTGKIEVRE